jgi:hypothetical protein
MASSTEVLVVAQAIRTVWQARGKAPRTLYVQNAVNLAPRPGQALLGGLLEPRAEPPSYARVVLGGFCKVAVLAGFAAKAQSPMVMADET